MNRMVKTEIARSKGRWAMEEWGAPENDVLHKSLLQQLKVAR